MIKKVLKANREVSSLSFTLELRFGTPPVKMILTRKHFPSDLHLSTLSLSKHLCTRSGAVSSIVDHCLVLQQVCFMKNLCSLQLIRQYGYILLVVLLHDLIPR